MPGHKVVERPNQFTCPVDASDLQTLLMKRAEGLHDLVRRRIPADLRSQISPEDILQEVWLCAFQNLSNLRSNHPNAFDRWLTKITERKVIDAFREARRVKRGARHQIQQVGQRRTTSFLDLFARVAADQRTPSSEEGAKEATHAVQVALTELPDDYRQAITLYHIQGRSHEEVAEAMHRSLSAVNGLLYRAMQSLREKLGSATGFLSDDGLPYQDVAPPLVGPPAADSSQKSAFGGSPTRGDATPVG